MNEVTIWHNPRCSKSRAALVLLTDRGIFPRVINYLTDPPGTAELERVLALLGLEPRHRMRLDESDYRTLEMGDARLGHSDQVALLQANPHLIQRPIVLANGKAVIGRSPEAILGIP